MAARVTLASRLPQVAASLRPRVSRAVKQGAEAVATEARARVALGPPPVHIRDHIEVRRYQAAGYRVDVDVADERGVPYPFVVEFGAEATEDSPARPAHPFLLPALESQRETCISLVEASLRGL